MLRKDIGHIPQSRGRSSFLLVTISLWHLPIILDYTNVYRFVMDSTAFWELFVLLGNKATANLKRTEKELTHMCPFLSLEKHNNREDSPVIPFLWFSTAVPPRTLQASTLPPCSSLVETESNTWKEKSLINVKTWQLILLT